MFHVYSIFFKKKKKEYFLGVLNFFLNVLENFGEIARACDRLVIGWARNRDGLG